MVHFTQDKVASKHFQRDFFQEKIMLLYVLTKTLTLGTKTCFPSQPAHSWDPVEEKF